MATNKPEAQGAGSEEESVPRHGWRGPSVSWMTAFASFRSDPVSCAGSFLQLTGIDFVNNLKGARGAFYLPTLSGVFQHFANNLYRFFLNLLAVFCAQEAFTVDFVGVFGA